jgi:hypothetical protein
VGITLLMELVADQYEMISTVEDALDAVICETLAQTEPLADDELEDVQAAAALPFMNQKNLKGEE